MESGSNTLSNPEMVSFHYMGSVYSCYHRDITPDNLCLQLKMGHNVDVASFENVEYHLHTPNILSVNSMDIRATKDKIAAILEAIDSAEVDTFRNLAKFLRNMRPESVYFSEYPYHYTCNPYVANMRDREIMRELACNNVEISRVSVGTDMGVSRLKLHTSAGNTKNIYIKSIYPGPVDLDVLKSIILEQELVVTRLESEPRSQEYTIRVEGDHVSTVYFLKVIKEALNIYFETGKTVAEYGNIYIG